LLNLTATLPSVRTINDGDFAVATTGMATKSPVNPRLAAIVFLMSLLMVPENDIVAVSVLPISLDITPVKLSDPLKLRLVVLLRLPVKPKEAVKSLVYCIAPGM